VIVALGKSAATTLLDVEATIASLRGRVHRYADVPLVVTVSSGVSAAQLARQAEGVGGSLVSPGVRCGKPLAPPRSPKRD
jgi:hypothetical protein